MRALPRAWVVGQVRQEDRSAIRHAIQTSRLPRGALFDPMRIALVEEPVAGARTCEEDCGTARVLAIADRSVTLEASAWRDAFLVSSDTWYPGWRAWIDGVEVPIHRTNYCLRGVALPAGTHEVRFEFHSQSFRAGAALTLASALLVIGTYFRRTPRR